MTVDIVEGDISTQDVDALVNAANDHFWMGAGVAGAIKARGGSDIEREAMAQGPVAPGDCVMTAGGRLRARHVIHAAVMGQDLRTSADIIARATTNALALAERHRLASMAFPAFGTGVGGFPLDECARIMLGVVRAHTPVSLALVRFVLYGEAACRAFLEREALMEREASAER